MAVTWDPAKTDASITLSNGNLTGTGTVNALKTGLATLSRSAGKYYWEVVCNASFTTNDNIGFGNAATADTYLGFDANSIGWINDGRVLLNNINIGSVATWASGSILSVAVDMGAKLIWFRVGAGNWNNDVLANQNPATGTGGRSLSTLSAGPYFPAMCPGQINTQFTADFGATAFAESMPAGFLQWAGPPPFTYAQARVIT